MGWPPPSPSGQGTGVPVVAVAVMVRALAEGRGRMAAVVVGSVTALVGADSSQRELNTHTAHTHTQRADRGMMGFGCMCLSARVQ